jgi:DNA-binding XRE family transcriptional regulator
VKGCTVLHMASSNEIGLLIQRARTRKRLTQAQLADLLEVSRRSVIAWEGGEVLPVQFTGAIEEALDIKIPPFGNQVPA